jgi:DNA uptake protein ComE-like DNA-binding protein
MLSVLCVLCVLWLLLMVVACGASNTPALTPTAAAPAAVTNASPTLVPAAVSPAAAPVTTAAATPTQSATRVTPVASTQIAVTKLNLNTASGDDYLKTIPGFSSRMVREFLEYRPYISIQQFRKEIGKYVSAQQVAEYEKYVYVPIDVNKSDAATLQQIPGLDANEVAELLTARPYANADAFLVKLAKYVSETELAIAKIYLSAP